MDNFFKDCNFLEIQYQNILLGNDLYLAPEIFKQIMRKEAFINLNFFICETFSIGMILLEMGL